MTSKKNLLLGVSGGIAAYKAADLVSLAVKAGFSVRVVMTPSATHFVGPLTFEAMSGHQVMTKVIATGQSTDGPESMRHIAWAKWADVTCVAPMSASTLARLATGLADTALSTTWLAVPPNTPNLLCPAMNTQMWNHPATQRNLAWIHEMGRYQIIAPVHKRLACGEVGVGGMAAPVDILAAIQSVS